MWGTILAGGASILNGLWNAHEDRKVAKRQQKLQEQQMQLQHEYMLQQQQRVQDWNEKYGSIEANMLNYVKHLDYPTLYNKADATVSRQFENARKNMEAHLSSRGFDVAGGVTADMFQNLAAQEAQTKIDLENALQQQVLNTQMSVLNGNRQPNMPNPAGEINLLGQQANVLGIQRQQERSDVNNILNAGAKLGGVLSTTSINEDPLARAKAKLKQQAQNNIVSATTTAQEVR